MAELADQETMIRVVMDIEAIKKLKYKFYRCLDNKLWDDITECLAENVTASFYGGKFKFEGVDALMQFLKEGLIPTRISVHHGHHPEIEITGDTTATGIWSVQTYVIDRQANISLSGVSLFHDEYVKEEGEWKIKSTACSRIYEEVWDRGEIKSLKLTQAKEFESPDGQCKG